MYGLFVGWTSSEQSLTRCSEDGQRLKCFKESLWAVELTFQPGFRPCRNVKEGGLYFGRKHRLFGYPVKVESGLKGLAYSASDYISGYFADSESFQRPQQGNNYKPFKSKADLHIFWLWTLPWYLWYELGRDCRQQISGKARNIWCSSSQK